MTTTRTCGAGRTAAIVLLAAAAITRPAQGQPTAGPSAEYAAAVAELERFIAHEMTDKRLPALSIALVDDQRVVWARGFGFANPADSTPATAETVYRVGSVSKLFTDIGIMQLVERGKIQLDSPVTRYLPDFRPRNPFGIPITLRQMMAHHSGLVREPPVGHYFDDTAPTLAQTIRSLNTTALVYKPGTHPKYSNAAIAAVGYVLERTQREPFPHYVKRAVLDPLDLGKSSFEPTPTVTRDLAKAYMWTIEGRTFEAPTFQLGMAPAGSMYSTVLDLGKFMSALFARGQGRAGRVLDSATIEAMWTPQFARPGATSGSGIGFGLSELEGKRLVGHGGAIYGFATELSALPDDKLGAVVVTTLDIANTITDRIAQQALRLMLAVRERRALPRLELTSPVSPELARRLEGRYGQGARAVDLIERAGELFLLPVRGGVRVAIRSLSGDTLVIDDRLTYGPQLIPLDGGRIIVGSDTLARAEAPTPRPIPARWAGLIGEYGWDHNTLFILERDGKLNALIEWFFMYPLEEVSPNVYKFPNAGLYDGERLIFTRDANGRATRVEAASVVFRRRAVGTEAGVTFRIRPVRPVDALRREALAAQPPAENGTFRAPDLVDVASLDSTIRLDIRYATTNNFLGTPLYRLPRAFLQRPAAEAVLRAHRKLRERGYGLLIHDAYRPWYITKIFWDAVPEDKRIFVANPADGSRHNRGAAVDLTMYDLKTGRPVQMVGGYDELSERSYPNYPGGTSLQRWHRELLRDAMEEQGFTVYEAEWWHFDYKDWKEYPILNVTFEKLTPAGRSESPSAGLRLDTARVDSVFAAFDRRDSPGCALGIIRDGRTLYARGYGMADLERGVPISPRTVFDIGSTSKQFTAASIALLAADGRLSLDDDVRKYIPELPQYGTPITLLNLLQHTSGLRDYIGLMNLAGMRFEDVTTDEDALAAITRQKALNFRPGAEHDYSNSGYFLASVVVARASGKSLAKFAQERIFAPLGMTSTLFRDDYASLVPNRAVAYTPADSGRFAIDMSDWEQTGDGAVHTTVEDLARWDQNFYTPTVGGPRLLERLLTPGRLSNGEPIEYALGLFVDKYRGLRRVHHGGSWAGYRAELIRFPDQRVSVTVLCNLATAAPSRLAAQVADIILAEHLQPATAAPRAAQAAATAPAADTRDAAATALELAQYTGTYFDERTNGIRRVTVDSGRLALQISGTTLPMRALGGDRFESTRYPITIAFRRQRPGASPHLEETIAGGRATTYAPVAAASLTPAALSAYAGTYYSEELATAWTLAARDSGLVLLHRALGDTRLQPAFTDALTAGPALLRFSRDAGSRISGFTVSVGRARNIGFVRREP